MGGLLTARLIKSSVVLPLFSPDHHGNLDAKYQPKPSLVAGSIFHTGLRHHIQ
jgi:hypothetical protein